MIRTVVLRTLSCFIIIAHCRGTSILGEVRNVEISRATQQLLCSKSHDFLAVFALAHSKINQISYFFLRNYLGGFWLDLWCIENFKFLMYFFNIIDKYEECFLYDLLVLISLFCKFVNHIIFFLSSYDAQADCSRKSHRRSPLLNFVFCTW